MSAPSTKQQLMSFDKALIVDELHSLLDTQQIAKLINNLQQSALKSPEQRKSECKSNEIAGKELDAKIDDMMEQLNIPQKNRNGLLKLPEHQKRMMLQQYSKQIDNQAPPPPPSEHKADNTRKNTFIIPDKKEIIKEGWLQKKGQYNTNYKKRWFVLFHNNTLAYFEKPEHVKTKKKAALGEISLYFVTEIKKKKKEDKNVGMKYKFELKSKDRTFVLKSEDSKPYDEWIGKIDVRIHPKVAYEGWAMKRGNSKQTWKRRYFVLVNYETNNSELRYYEDKYRKRFKGLVDMSEVQTVQTLDGQESTKKYGRSHDKCLELVTAPRTYVMSFKDINIRNVWKDHVTNLKFDDDIAKHIDNKLFQPTMVPVNDDVKSEAVPMGMSDTLSMNRMIVQNISAQSSAAVEESNEEEQEQAQEEQEQEVNNPSDEEDSDSFGLDITEDNEENALPAGWIVLYTEDGRAYYYNEGSGATVWEKPT